MKKLFLIIFAVILVIVGVFIGIKIQLNKTNVDKNKTIYQNNIDNNAQENELPDKDTFSKRVIPFSEEKCFAIGYINDLKQEEFKEKYFEDGTFDNLPVYDFRQLSERKDGYGNKFVIIPKSEEIKLTVYDSYMDEDDMKVHLDNILIDNISTPFVILDDYIEYIPKMYIKYIYNGEEKLYPILFNGLNGHLNLKDYEKNILDISIY